MAASTIVSNVVAVVAAVVAVVVVAVALCSLPAHAARGRHRKLAAAPCSHFRLPARLLLAGYC